MAHYSRVYMIAIDVPPQDHDQELAFWHAASGEDLAQVKHHPEFHAALLRGQEAGLIVQRLGEGPARVHLDIHTDDLAAEVARLEALGACRVHEAAFWWVMRDPAGLLFCVVAEPPGRLTDRNAHRWH